MDSFDEKKFRRAVSGLPSTVIATIAIRAAMRVLPILAGRRTSLLGAQRRPVAPFSYWNNSDQAGGHLFGLFRSYQASIFIDSLIATDQGPARAASDVANKAAEAARNAARVVSNAVEAAVNASEGASSDHDTTMAALEACSTVRVAASAASAAIAAFAGRDASGYAAAVPLATANAPALEAALQSDITLVRPSDPSMLGRFPLWPVGMSSEITALWQQLSADLLDLGAGFEVWIDWYKDRLDGTPLDMERERSWALLSKERLAQSPAAINAHLKALRDGAAEMRLKRVRAIFLGYGGVGKTSLISALHGETVVEGQQAMTKGVAIQGSRRRRAGTTPDPAHGPCEGIDEGAGVFTRVTSFDDRDLTVHFWDFGGQVMAHATHQFFLRANCLYGIVLDARKERNANEEAEYWLEHVRAFGDSAQVMVVGNKSDQAPVNLDLRSLKEKHPNVIDFYALSCTEAKGAFRKKFEVFRDEFERELKELGNRGERFNAQQFRVLEAVQSMANADDFLSHNAFDKLCADSGIASEGPLGRGQLLDLLDKLGIVIHFPGLPFLTDFVLNPRWLTYGVYTIMYSERAHSKKGHITEQDAVEILKPAALPSAGDKRALRYPPDRCQLIVNAMVAFRLAYRVSRDQQRLVIPALLAPEQPAHDFKSEGAMAFQFDFKGFLPRHVLPTLIVEHHTDIAETGDDDQIVWQNGVLLRPNRGVDAEALVTADYNERNLNILVTGTDAATYLGHVRDSILKTLQTMPELRFEENVRLRPDMRVDGEQAGQDEKPVWVLYEVINTVRKAGRKDFAAGRHYYDLSKVLSVMPVSPVLKPADVFISYKNVDRPIIDRLAAEIEKAGITVWFDKELIPGQRYREIIAQRIEAAKAVVVVWTANSVGSDWVIDEAQRAGKKLICLRDPALEIDSIPAPFSSNVRIEQLGKHEKLMVALRRLGAGRQAGNSARHHLEAARAGEIRKMKTSQPPVAAP